MYKGLILSFAMGAMAGIGAVSAATGRVKGFYWIDSDTPVAISLSASEIDVSGLHDGFHTFGFISCNDAGEISTPQSSVFIKLPVTGAAGSELGGTLLLDGKELSNVQLRNVGSGMYAYDADMSKVSPGVHSLQLFSFSKTGAVSNIAEAWFMRVPIELELSYTEVAYFIDGSYVGRQGLTMSDTVWLTDINTAWLQPGLHSIDFAMVFADGSITPFEHQWFYRMPIPNGITAYDYWFDDDCQNSISVTLEQPVTDLGIITMVDVPELPFDSRKYQFSLQDGKPYVNEKHALNMRFYESDGRAITKVSDFTESRKGKPIENLETLSEGLNKVRTSDVNEIKWYEFKGELGDSIALSSNRAAMLELYSPTGEELIRKRGPKSQEQTTFTLIESGTYYLAAHSMDIKSLPDFDISFSHIPRNAILTVSPDKNLSGSAYTSIELFGNGMKDAKSVAISSSDGVMFQTDEVFKLDNYHLSATVSHPDSIPAGIYDVSMVVVDRISGEEKTIVKPMAIAVADSLPAPEIKVEVIPSRKAATPYIVDIYVTNDSDAPCWGIPFNVACERDRGKNGFILYMQDFLGSSVFANNVPWYESEDILGTGKDGVFFPVTITSLQPHERRRLRVGITSEPHNRVGLYAWAGTPYSEEARQLKALPEDSLRNLKVEYSNLFDLKTATYIMTALDEIRNYRIPENDKKIRRAQEDDNRVLEYLADYGPDAVGHYTPFEHSSDAASQVANTYVALAKTEASIFNLGVKGRTAHEQLTTNCGYTGNPREVMMQIEADFPNCENDIENITNPQTKYWYKELKNAMAKAVPPHEILQEAYEPTEMQLARDAADIFVSRNARSNNPMPTRHEIDVMMSGDPNMLTGYSDPCGGPYIGIDVNTLDYTIEFENDPTIANAPASTIVVENSFDGSVFDLSSFVPKELRIGNHMVKVPESHHFVKTVDMRPEIDCIAEIKFDYDAATGKATWNLESLDPLTLAPAADFRQGLLPVNDGTGRGVGYIDYSIRLKDDIGHDTPVVNKAVITFDDNDPIATPTWNNLTDYIRPISKIIENVGYSDGGYNLTVEYGDEGSGMYGYDLYIRNGDTDKWRVVMSGLSDTQIRFETPEPIPGVQFMTVATDRAGNRQTDINVPTGIGRIEVDSANDSDSQIWYNLQGIPVPDQGENASGIIISNKGRKIIVR